MYTVVYSIKLAQYINVVYLYTIYIYIYIQIVCILRIYYVYCAYTGPGLFLGSSKITRHDHVV